VLIFFSFCKGPFQDSLIHTYKPSSPHVMFFSNVWASIVMFIGMPFPLFFFFAVSFFGRKFVKLSKKNETVSKKPKYFAYELLFWQMKSAFLHSLRETAAPLYLYTEFPLFICMSPLPNIILRVVVLVSGDLLPAISFCVAYPEIITPIAMFSICSALGQNFVSLNPQKREREKKRGAG
jgi:hypothetical protein